MDVSLVVTHRCNLACSYCYAGEHHGRAMDRAVVDRALPLLYADEPEVAQLGFFGGEPMLAFDTLCYAVARARELAAGRRLLVHVTSNGTLIGAAEAAVLVEAGVGVTVSVDGTRKAHDRQRLRAGGQSSFDDVRRGLRALVVAGGAPDALLVITPETVPELEASVAWLWSEGIEVVRANLDLRAAWTPDDRDDLRAALLRIGADLVRLRQTGHDVMFEPLADAIAQATGGPRHGSRPRVVVGTTGNLYPCSPMVGEDRDDGREARLRIGHVSDPPAEIVRRVFAEGVHCSSKGNCACAAYIETGAFARLGPNGSFWKQLCQRVGAAVGAELAGETPAAPAPVAVAASAGLTLEAREPARERPRRAALVGGVLMGAGALGFVTASLPGLLRMVHSKRACHAGAAAALADGSEIESVDVAEAAGMSDATGLPQQSVLDRVALQRALALKAAEPVAHPIPKPGPPRHHHPAVRPPGELHIDGDFE